MSKLELKYYPAEVLKEKAKKVTRFDTSVRKLAQDMLDTMYENSGVGLAAPQIGVSKQMMVIDTARSDEEPPRPIVFINPVLLKAEGELIGLEGCLSFPGVFFEVKRAASIVVKYQNLEGTVLKMSAQGDLLCRAIQHEIDHLNGELFIDKAVSRLAADIELSKHGFGSEPLASDAPMEASADSVQHDRIPMLG